MDRYRKLKREKSDKKSNTDKQPVFITDVKSIKENLKIKEILRTVKMSSSMRLKPPPDGKIMTSTDFNDEDCFEESSMNQNCSEPLSATNPDVLICRPKETDDISCKDFSHDCESISVTDEIVANNNSECDYLNIKPPTLVKTKKLPQNNRENTQNDGEISNKIKITIENMGNRKLSTDHTNLVRREGFSQSELDLHSIGKSPLERKSSFFKKTMDSFVRNTTEMFRKQNKPVQSRVSMSVSLQSLNDKTLRTHDYSEVPIQQVNDNMEEDGMALRIPSQIVRSNSSLPTVQRQSPEYSPAESLTGSQSAIHALSTSALGNVHSSSVHSLNEAYLKEAMLNSRAISMSSGLDSSFGQPRKKASRFNRVTWVASEGMTNYLRRVIQDEKSKEVQSCQSHQDFSSIPENELYSKPESKGRRLSYQRAVSGEDPVLQTKYQNSSLKKKHQVTETDETHEELATILRYLSRRPMTSLEGFEVAQLSFDAILCLIWGSDSKIIRETCTYFNSLPKREQDKQSALHELITSEVEHIKSLIAMLEIFVATAQFLQSNNKLQRIQTSKLFSNLPEVLNSSLRFWSAVFVPMIKDAIMKDKPLNAKLMFRGFKEIGEILYPYEKFVLDQSSLLEYYRSMQMDPEFSIYLSWCHSQEECNRLQLNDFLVKPMQRLTKYSLFLTRILKSASKIREIQGLQYLERFVTSYVLALNDSIKYYKEIDSAHNLEGHIDPYESELKDDTVERYFKLFMKINLKSPMLHCLPYHDRCLIHVANLRFRDGAKESDARVFLTTDMLLVCKRVTKGIRHYRLIRPKYPIDKLVAFPKFVSKKQKDLSGLGYVVIDDLGSACGSFMLSEPSKDPNPQETLRLWENKFKEARLTYELLIWSSQNPHREMTDTEMQNLMESLQLKTRLTEDQANMEREVRQRVVSVLLRNSSASFYYDTSKNITDVEKKVIIGRSARLPGPNQKDHLFRRTLPAVTTCTWRLSNVQKYYSLLQDKNDKRRTTRKPPLLMIEGPPNVEEVANNNKADSQTPATTMMQATLAATINSCMSEFSTLHEQPKFRNYVQSSPNLNISPKRSPCLSVRSTSQKKYQSHQELLQRTKLEDIRSRGHLVPDNRDIDYTPHSPTRGVLKRAFAFSQSFKKPPLIRMDHVESQSPTKIDAPSTSQQKPDTPENLKSPANAEKSDMKSKAASRRKLRDEKERLGKLTLWPKKNRSQLDKQESMQWEENSSYFDESLDSSFVDDSVESIYMDLESSINRNGSRNEDYDYNQRKESSVTIHQVPEITLSVDSLSLKSNYLEPNSETEPDKLPFHKIDPPESFTKQSISYPDIEIKNSGDVIMQKNVISISNYQDGVEDCRATHSVSYPTNDLVPKGMDKSYQTASSSRIDRPEAIIKEESAIIDNVQRVDKKNDPECSPETNVIQYEKFDVEQEDNDSTSLSKYESTSSSSSLEAVSVIEKQIPSQSSKDEERQHKKKQSRMKSGLWECTFSWCT